MDDSKSKENDQKVPTSPVRKNIELFESKFGSKIKGPAPLPPGKQIHLPKIGNYKPKSLSPQQSVEKTNVSSQQVKPDGFFFEEIVISENTDEKENETKNKIVKRGDESDVSEPDQSKYTENPLFSESELNSPLIPGEDTTYEPGVDNPLFISPPADYPLENEPVYTTPLDRPEPPPRKKKSSKNKETSPLRAKNKQAPPPPSSPLSNQTFHEDNKSYPFIPEPDYEDEIPSSPIQNGRPGSRYTMSTTDELLYKEYEGEDYSKYLSDEDDSGFYETFTGRGKIKYRRKNVRPQAPPPPRPQSAPPVKPIKNNMKRQDLKPIGKKDVVTENNKRNTIRDFSFTDSKMGYDINRTAKSTSAKGRYEKRGKERPRIGTETSSYEDFLRMRHNENGSNSSADSGHEIGEESYLKNVYMRSQPNLHDGKASLWKKLTWRFRRHAAGYDMS